MHINRTRQGVPLLSSKAHRALGFINLPANGKEEEDGVRHVGHRIFFFTCLCAVFCSILGYFWDTKSFRDAVILKAAEGVHLRIKDAR